MSGTEKGRGIQTNGVCLTTVRLVFPAFLASGLEMSLSKMLNNLK